MLTVKVKSQKKSLSRSLFDLKVMKSQLRRKKSKLKPLARLKTWRHTQRFYWTKMSCSQRMTKQAHLKRTPKSLRQKLRSVKRKKPKPFRPSWRLRRPGKNPKPPRLKKLRLKTIKTSQR